MKKLQKTAMALTVMILSMSIPISSFALTTKDFDKGMSKGINYFNRGLYYEAKDEFQWFCDANWGKMNAGQQKYALDYLNGSYKRIQKWEESQKYISLDKAKQIVVNYFGIPYSSIVKSWDNGSSYSFYMEIYEGGYKDEKGCSVDKTTGRIFNIAG